MKTRPSSPRLPLVVLLVSLAAGAVALARQQDPKPPRVEGIMPLDENPFGAGRGASQAESTAAAFLEQNQQLASRRLAELTEECDRLREELEAAEQERARWQAINEAMASVPERFGQLTATPAPSPHPTAARSPFGEPSLDLPPTPEPTDNPFEPAPSRPGPFDLPGT